MSVRHEIDRALLKLEQEPPGSGRAEVGRAICSLAAENETHGDDFRELLPRLIADEQDDVRRSGVQLAAMVLRDEALETFLAERLRDPSPRVRVEATGQLADMHRQSARPHLAPMLAHQPFQIRFEAARGIAALGHSAGLEVLTEALGHADFRFRALGALGELGDQRALPAVKKISDRWFLPAFDRTQAAGVRVKLGDASGAVHLFKRMGKRWSPDRAMAIELAGEVNAPAAAERLKAILVDPRDPCRGAAARGLGRLKDSESLALLERLLADPATPLELRLDAAEGLCYAG
ncbi:MAG: HEAT repeat domain-containing protein, partial [Myxococcaceae bacterium]